jgi:hypothetical protein
VLSLLALFVGKRCASLRASTGAQIYLLYLYKSKNVLTPKELVHLLARAAAGNRRHNSFSGLLALLAQKNKD